MRKACLFSTGDTIVNLQSFMIINSILLQANIHMLV